MLRSHQPQFLMVHYQLNLMKIKLAVTLWQLVLVLRQTQHLQRLIPKLSTEDIAKAFLFDAGVSLSELVDAINSVGATP